MNEDNKGSLDTLIEETLNADTDFNDTLTDMSDEDREIAISEKKSEITKQVYSDLEEKSTKNEELAKNYKIRAERAEGRNKPPKEEVDTSKKPDEKEKSDLSTKDFYSLVDAKIPQEDVEEVMKASKLLGKTIPEALKDDTVKAILEKRAEHRKTAEATNTATARPGSKKVSGAEITAKADKGDFPEKGSEEADALFWERRGGKR